SYLISFPDSAPVDTIADGRTRRPFYITSTREKTACQIPATAVSKNYGSSVKFQRLGCQKTRAVSDESKHIIIAQTKRPAMILMVLLFEPFRLLIVLFGSS
ncbi:MAG: hypothetical protein LBN12_06390, partial [Clostridiales Family XIII bacterium]|nr:hypothetical protein [Clostridiales Family XIII bacterium]